MRGLAAAVALCLCLVAQGAVAQEVSEDARALFREGVQLLKLADGADYVGAYAKFKAAYADSPSPKILGNLGLCALKLERYGEAREAYEAYLSTAPGISPAERKAIAGDLAAMKTGGGTVTITSSVGDIVVRDERKTRDGKLVVNEYASPDPAVTIFVRAGSHRFIVSAPGHQPGEVTMTVSGGGTVEEKVSLVPKETSVTTVTPVVPVAADDAESDGVGAGFWVSFAITGAAGVAAGIVGGLTIKKHGDFDDAQAAGDLTRAKELSDSGRTLSITTDVLLGVTGAAAIVTTILLITGLSNDDDGEARLRMSPEGVVVSF